MPLTPEYIQSWIEGNPLKQHSSVTTQNIIQAVKEVIDLDNIVGDLDEVRRYLSMANKPGTGYPAKRGHYVGYYSGGLLFRYWYVDTRRYFSQWPIK